MNDKKLKNICCKYLINNGFEIIDTDYKYILDIVAFKKGIIHFFKTESVSRETLINKNSYKYNNENDVSCENINKIEKTVKLFLLEKGFKDEYIQIDLLKVYLIENNREEFNYFINYIPNINFI